MSVDVFVLAVCSSSFSKCFSKCSPKTSRFYQCYATSDTCIVGFFLSKDAPPCQRFYHSGGCFASLFSEVTRILKQSGGGVVEWEQGWAIVVGGGLYDESGLEMGEGGELRAVQFCSCACACLWLFGEEGGRKGSEVLEQKISPLPALYFSLSVTGPDVKQQQFVRFHSSPATKKTLTVLR